MEEWPSAVEIYREKLCGDGVIFFYVGDWQAKITKTNLLDKKKISFSEKKPGVFSIMGTLVIDSNIDADYNNCRFRIIGADGAFLMDQRALDYFQFSSDKVIQSSSINITEFKLSI